MCSVVTGMSKGYAFIEYKHKSDAEEACRVERNFSGTLRVCIVCLHSIRRGTRRCLKGTNCLLILNGRELCLDGFRDDWVQLNP